MIALCSIIAFFVAIQSAFVASLFEECEQVRNLTSGGQYTFQSPNYSNTDISKRYEAGSSCRLHLVAPQGYFIRLAGRISLDRKTSVQTCIGQGQKFLVSRDGMKDFYHADIFCSSETLAIDSVGSEMTVGYISDKDGAGRFQMVAKAVKVSKDNCDCGWGYYSFTRQYSSRLFRGFTSIVGIYHVDKDEIVCTGTIISSRHVVLAAHCLSSINEPKSELLVLAGFRSYPSDDYPQFQTNYTIDSVKIHEKYSSASLSQLNDIALIKTVNVIRFSRGVSPICLPGAKVFGETDYYKIKYDLVAWTKYNDDGLEQTLLNTTVVSYSNVNCNKSFKAFQIASSQLCTYIQNTTVASAEYPGAALIYTLTDRKCLVGIFNLNVKHTQPVVYTRVSAYTKWISDATSGDFICNRFY